MWRSSIHVEPSANVAAAVDVKRGAIQRRLGDSDNALARDTAGKGLGEVDQGGLAGAKGSACAA
ncbi:MAG: hypothetical protein ACRESJ_02075 [Pseudomonas sp.]|uniref:hypothetical protein n=1 Tax=Pseudomonas sp. TaxID=306 RepID=UPI003D6F1042